MTRKDSKVLAILTTVVVVSLGLDVMPAQAADDLERFRAFAVHMGSASGSTVVDIHITRWSTEEERASLLEALQKKGHEEFVKALRKEKETGWFQGEGALSRMNPFPSTRVHFARQYEENGKRHILLVTDRPIGRREVMRGDQSEDYNVTAIMMEFPLKPDKDGKKAHGTGTAYLALKVGIDKKTHRLKLEEWGNDPVRLTDVKPEK